MNLPESIIEKGTHEKILWDFEIATYHLNPTRRSNSCSFKKKNENLLSKGFYCSSRPWREKEKRENNDKNLNLCREVEKLGDSDNNCSRFSQNGPKRPERRLNELEI